MKRREYVLGRHGLTPQVADDALSEPERVVIDTIETAPAVHAPIVDDVPKVIVLERDGTEYGVNGWPSNAKDRRIYSHEQEGESDEEDS